MTKYKSNPGGAIVTGLLLAALAWFFWARYLKTGSRITFDQDVQAVKEAIGIDWDRYFDDPDNPYGAAVLDVKRAASQTVIPADEPMHAPHIDPVRYPRPSRS